jgi:hypothetical protein
MIYPLSEHVRERVRRRQQQDRPAWDAVVPGDQHGRVVSLHQASNHIAQRPKPATSASAKTQVVLLLPVGHSSFLTDGSLLDCSHPDANNPRGERWMTTDPRRVR